MELFSDSGDPEIEDALNSLPERILDYQGRKVIVGSYYGLDRYSVVLEDDPDYQYAAFLYLKKEELIVDAIFYMDTSFVKKAQKEWLNHTYEGYTVLAIYPEGDNLHGHINFLANKDGDQYTFFFRNELAIHELTFEFKQILKNAHDLRNLTGEERLINTLPGTTINVDTSKDGKERIQKLSFIRILGKGNQAAVLLAELDKEPVAVKVFTDPEIVKIPAYGEGAKYDLLQGKPPPSIPKFYGYYNIKDKMGLLIIQFLGPDMDVQLKIHGLYTEAKVIPWALQLIDALEYLGKQGIVHNDVKPANILLLDNRVYLSDFGLCLLTRKGASLRKGVGLEHIASPGRHGTPLYASLAATRGDMPTTNDDLEGLCYTFMYLICGNLPWQHLSSSATSVEDLWEQLAVMKGAIDSFNICDKSKKFARCLRLVRDAKPDDMSLYQKFREILQS